MVEVVKASEHFLVGQQPGAQVVAPAIGLGHGRIERGMGVCQPLGSEIVKVGERALLLGRLRWRLRGRASSGAHSQELVTRGVGHSPVVQATGDV